MKTLLAILFLSLSVWAQKAAQDSTEFNKILFSIAGQSWSQRDQQIYQGVLAEIFKQKKLHVSSENEDDDFLLSRLAEKESSLFDLSYQTVKATEAQKKKLSAFTSAEIEKEIDSISKATAILEIKAGQLKDPARFKAWLELLKRKYQFKLKSGPVNATP